MNLRIAKWGNSLALRIPSAVARQLGLHDGDTVRTQVTADKSTIRATRANSDKNAFATALLARSL